MTYWKPHALAKPHADQLDLRVGDHVTATIDLHVAADGAVAEGTAGRILLANGFNWQRYRVLFNNGIEIGDLDGRQIAAAGKTAKRLAKAAAKRS
ncbi:MAG: hypothetical protein JWN39_4207 [Ilumatobacteraceae bacterium]|nr:hypothetical protein [Ilumatobacteraceae bacterium]